MNHRFKMSYQAYMWLVLISIMLIRLLFLGAYPLGDTTEARYGEMGRLILATGDWITPQIREGVPFWGKPPLSFWLTAVSYKILGINEFSARLPSFLLALTVIVMVWKLASFQMDNKFSLMGSVIMTSSVIFWISSGAVMTDHCLLAGTTLSMISFWHCIKLSGKQEYWWGIVFFVGLAIGLLAKGPVAAVMIFLPIFAWSCIRKTPLVFLQRLPWVTGSILTLLLTVPWYWMAEIKTPGFLEYFFVGEHWNRFLISGWKGDLYGSAHFEPRGMIWLFWLVSAFPWSFVVLFQFKSKTMRQRLLKKTRDLDGWYLYLIFWAISPMVFFTMAGNILYAYVLPGIPAFALLTAEIFRLNQNVAYEKIIKRVSFFMVILCLIASMAVSFGIGPAQNSQKQLISAYYGRIEGEKNKLSYLFKRPFSAAFYSQEKAGEIITISQMALLNENGYKDYLAIKDDYLPNISSKILNRFEKLEKIHRYFLFREN